MVDLQTREAVFTGERRRLLGLAYRMLGSRDAAEDVLQDAWLRWQVLDTHDIVSPPAWLTTLVSRLCLDELRARKVRQRDYVGPWLPEPWEAEPPPSAGDTASVVELADDLSMAFLLVLERLSPEERAAFLLHDVFDVPFAAIGNVVGRQEATVRQSVARARKRVREERRRFHASPTEQRRLAETFLAGMAQRDEAALLGLFHERVVLTSDGGGKVLAALRPIVGRDKVIRFFFGITRDISPGDLRFEFRWLNDAVSLVAFDAQAQPVIAVIFEYAEGQVVHLYAIRNPDKLKKMRLT
ncbi:MAG: RNA polymerase sigma factor SigJ [Pseudomonadales bacterium]|nr:RNA polymerase sigma factor SigJ [Pseudomonadales bacterium]MCP5182966.1 RNA polymerase sigma factor SigJ [Pseudomonadales bacterium]